MSRAAKILEEVEAAGGIATVLGDNLHLKAPAPLPASLTDQVRRHKSEILATLKGGQTREYQSQTKQPTETWTGKDWRVFFEERAAIAEFDGGLNRPGAERQAFEDLVSFWLAANPPTDLDPNHCGVCRNPLGQIGRDAVPLFVAAGTHVWAHHGCVADWHRLRRSEAATVLRRCGVSVGGTESV